MRSPQLRNRRVVANLLPIPTPVIVIAWMPAKIADTLVLTVIAITNFAKLLLVGLAIKFGTDGKTVDDFVREKLGVKVRGLACQDS